MSYIHIKSDSTFIVDIVKGGPEIMVFLGGGMVLTLQLFSFFENISGKLSCILVMLGALFPPEFCTTVTLLLIKFSSCRQVLYIIQKSFLVE